MHVNQWTGLSVGYIEPSSLAYLHGWQFQRWGTKTQFFGIPLSLLKMTKIFKGYYWHCAPSCIIFMPFSTRRHACSNTSVSECVPSWLEPTWCNLQMYHICRFFPQFKIRSQSLLILKIQYMCVVGMRNLNVNKGHFTHEPRAVTL